MYPPQVPQDGPAAPHDAAPGPVTDPPKHLVLALSGGGFRATLFHLGGLLALRDHDLLRGLKDVVSVSGGSILAAHLAQHWPSYSGSSDACRRAATDVLRLAQRDLRGEILRRVPFLLMWKLALASAWVLACAARRKTWAERLQRRAWRANSTFLLARRLNQFLGWPSGLEMLRGEAGARPGVRLLATNISTKQTCAFLADGWRASAAGSAGSDVLPPTLTLGRAVSASAAFPAFFPPERLSRWEFGWSLQAFGGDHQFLSDGGVLDNTGGAVGADLADPATLLVLSDASGCVEWETQRRMDLVIGSAPRILNLMMDQTREHLLRRLLAPASDTEPRLRPLHVAIDSDCLEPALRSVRSQLKSVRTDLDAFEPVVCAHLVLHGYETMGRRLAERGLGSRHADPVGVEGWLRQAARVRVETPESELETVRGAQATRLRLFSIKDPASWLLVGLLLLPLVLVWLLASGGSGASEPSAWDAPIAEDVAVLEALQPLQEPGHPVTASAPLPEPQYVDFDVLYDRRIFDLRHVRRGAVHEADGQAVNLLRVVAIRKKSEHARAINFEFRTTGRDVFLKVLGSQWPASIQSFTRPVKTGADVMNVRLLNLEVEGLPVGVPAVIMIQATSFGGFTEQPSSSWAGALGLVDGCPLSLAVVFSDAGMASEARRLRKPPNKVTFEPWEGGDPLVQSLEPPFLAWRVPRAERGAVYRLEWRWPE